MDTIITVGFLAFYMDVNREHQARAASGKYPELVLLYAPFLSPLVQSGHLEFFLAPSKVTTTCTPVIRNLTLQWRIEGSQEIHTPLPLPPQPHPSDRFLFRASSSSEIIAHEAKPESHPNDFYHSVTSK